jgi:hypothetical protein
MRRLLLVVALVSSLAAHAAPPIHVLPGLSLSRIPEALTAKITWPNTTEIDARKDAILLLGRDNLWQLGTKQGMFAMPLKLSSFARSDAGTLAAAADGKIGLVSGHMFLPAVAEPETGMRLAGGPGDTLILYGTHAPARIYSFDGKTVATLATLDKPITALTHLGGTVIFATADGIFSLRVGEPPGLLFPLAGHAPITALAADAKTAELFAATDDAVYQLDEGRMTEIAEGIGGALAVLEDHILVADPSRKTVYVLAGGSRSKGSGPVAAQGIGKKQ